MNSSFVIIQPRRSPVENKSSATGAKRISMSAQSGSVSGFNWLVYHNERTAIVEIEPASPTMIESPSSHKRQD